MQVLFLIIVLVVAFKVLADYKPLNKRIEEADNNPCNSIKSDKWYRENNVK